MNERQGKIEEVKFWKVTCDFCDWDMIVPNYDEGSIHLTCHLETAHKKEYENPKNDGG